MPRCRCLAYIARDTKRKKLSDEWSRKCAARNYLQHEHTNKGSLTAGNIVHAKESIKPISQLFRRKTLHVCGFEEKFSVQWKIKSCRCGVSGVWGRGGVKCVWENPDQILNDLGSEFEWLKWENQSRSKLRSKFQKFSDELLGKLLHHQIKENLSF